MEGRVGVGAARAVLFDGESHGALGGTGTNIHARGIDTEVIGEEKVKRR